jgi:hypothetical protein
MGWHELGSSGLGYGSIVGNVNTVMNHRVSLNPAKFEKMPSQEILGSIDLPSICTKKITSYLSLYNNIFPS